MRVIAGRWKGRRLHSPAGTEVRPTTDRVKEALFNILGEEIRDCLFLDLCCGAGGLGIEALSRGAALAVFIDRSRRSLAAVRDNLALCGADLVLTRLVCAEAAEWLERWNPGPDTGPWILVADPPYRSDAAGAIMKELYRLKDNPGFRAGVVEHGAGTPGMDSEPDGGLIRSSRRYGESYLAVVRPELSGPSKGE